MPHIRRPGSSRGAAVTSRYLTSLEIDVSPDGHVIRCGMDRIVISS